jgi:O-methyltransferase
MVDHPDSTFVGFDTFEGLPEMWGPWPKGSFTADGETPDIVDPRCSFVKWLFQDTLPGWLSGREFPGRTLVHLDADLYSSTLVVLAQLLPKI